MYEAFFKLEERPFTAAPLANRFYPAAAIEHARQTLHRTIDRAEGVGLVVGPSGTGKTLLLQVLAEQFRERFIPVVLSSGRLSTARALLQAILFEMNLPYRHMDESELRLSLVDHLSPPKLSGEGLLLLVDEAHTLPFRLLEELRMITNLMRDGAPRVRVIMGGSPKLEERFASPRLDSFSQRLSARCYLESLSRDETAGYVRSQIATVGGDPAILFQDDALVAVYRATDGIPRLINQVCDHALLLASLGGVQSMNSAAIEEAWADLQQLPAPWNAAETTKSIGTRVVEFGGLDDAGDDLPEAIPFPVGTKQPLSSVVEFGDSLDSPEEQINRIEAHLNELAELDEDFQPAGSIGPEVELVFRGGNNPFGDQFAEEEVVLDRYASLEADVFENRPLVNSQEGRELGDLLAPHARYAAADTVPLSQAVVDAKPPVAAVTKTETIVAASTMVADTDDSQAFEIDDEDADLIIVEDDAHMTITAVPPPLVRKQEYRQLFAKLRRG